MFFFCRQSTNRSVSSSSGGDSPQRENAGGVSLEEEEEEERTSLDIYSTENIKIKPIKQYVTAVSPRQTSTNSVVLTPQNSCSPRSTTSSTTEQQQKQFSANIPNKVRRISQNSARSSPPLREVQLDTLSNDSSSGSLLDRTAVCAGFPFADQMSLGSISIQSANASVGGMMMRPMSRSPVHIGSAIDETHLPKLLKPQAVHHSNVYTDRK